MRLKSLAFRQASDPQTKKKEPPGYDERDGSALLETAQEPESLERQHGEQLVAIRPEILSDAEHALGNLLQRMHHLARVSRDNLGAHAERLQTTLEDLEHLLELLFDYVTPVDVELGPIDAVRVAESLLSQVRAYGGKVDVGELPKIKLLVDSRVLSRSFQLLGRAFGRDWEAALRTSMEVNQQESLDRVELCVRSELAPAASGSADGDLALAVATRLIEQQGGEIRREVGDGSLTCSIILPSPKAIHASR